MVEGTYVSTTTGGYVSHTLIPIRKSRKDWKAESLKNIPTPKNFLESIKFKLREITDFSHVFRTPYDPKTIKPMITSNFSLIKDHVKELVKDEFIPKVKQAIDAQSSEGGSNV